MKLEELVPPLELCKQIPEGEFADSALVWAGDQFYQNIRVLPRGCQCIKIDAVISPAPTLAEILAALGDIDCGTNCECENEIRIGLWWVSVWRGGFRTSKQDKNPATAALKLWLEVK